MVSRPPLSRTDHGIQNSEQFPHAGDERELLRFAGADESLIEHADDGVALRGHKRAHVEHRAHIDTPTLHEAAADRRIISLKSVSAIRSSRLLHRPLATTKDLAQALEDLLCALEPPLLDHVRTIVNDQDLADDVMQEALLRVSRALGSLREPEWVRAWAYRIATREAIRAARAERDPRREAIDDWSDFSAPDQGDAVAGDDLLDELAARLDELPRRAQLALRMRYLQELSQQEIAEALEIPVGTVKSRIAYGLSALRRFMDRRA